MVNVYMVYMFINDINDITKDLKKKYVVLRKKKKRDSTNSMAETRLILQK